MHMDHINNCRLKQEVKSHDAQVRETNARSSLVPILRVLSAIRRRQITSLAVKTVCLTCDNSAETTAESHAHEPRRQIGLLRLLCFWQSDANQAEVILWKELSQMFLCHTQLFQIPHDSCRVWEKQVSDIWLEFICREDQRVFVSPVNPSSSGTHPALQSWFMTLDPPLLVTVSTNMKWGAP